MKDLAARIAGFILTIVCSFVVYAAGYYCYIVSRRLLAGDAILFPSLGLFFPALPLILAAAAVTALLLSLMLAVRLGGGFFCALLVLALHGGIWGWALPQCINYNLHVMPALAHMSPLESGAGTDDLGVTRAMGARASMLDRINPVSLDSETIFGDTLAPPSLLSWGALLLGQLWRQGIAAWQGGWIVWLGFSAMAVPLGSLVFSAGVSRKKMSNFALVAVLFVLVAAGNGLFYSTQAVYRAGEWTRALLSVAPFRPPWLPLLEPYLMILLGNLLAAVLICYNTVLMALIHRRHRVKKMPRFQKGGV
jgi:hypothetical protein